jgi:membrane protease YdiL (CAAX protease family)
MASALVDAGVLAVVTVCSALLQGKEIVARLRLGPTRATAVGMTSAVVGMIGLSFACGAASELIGVRGGGVMDTLARALQSLSPGQFAIALVTIGLAPGLAEETFFRGLIQTQLAARWGRWPAIVAASFGFALIHLDPVQGALAFFAGLYLGWLVERFGSIRASIVAHASNNMIFVTIGVFGGGGSSTRRGALAVAAIGAAMWASCMTVLRSRVAVSGDVTAPGGSATEAR